VPDLDGVDVKLARAHHHLNDLTAQVDHELATWGYTFSSAIEGTPPVLVFRVHGIPTVKPEWSAIVGDILTNLRAALDHLAWQLVILDGQVPGHQTSFPLVDSPANRAGHSRTIVKPRGWKHGDPGLLRPDLRATVESVQPYQYADSSEGARQGALWQLGHLCNVDKHRELLIVNLFPDDVWWGSAEGDPSPIVTYNAKPEHDGAWVVRFDFAGKEPPEHFTPHVGRLVVVLDEGPATLFTSPIQHTLAAMTALVEDTIVNAFRPFFV